MPWSMNQSIANESQEEDEGYTIARICASGWPIDRAGAFRPLVRAFSRRLAGRRPLASRPDPVGPHHQDLVWSHIPRNAPLLAGPAPNRDHSARARTHLAAVL